MVFLWLGGQATVTWGPQFSPWWDLYESLMASGNSSRLHIVYCLEKVPF